MNPSWWTAVGALVVLGTQAIVFFRWIARRMRDDDIARAFLKDLATVHLPHLYGSMQKLAEVQGVELDPQPLVQFVAFNGGRKAS